MNRYSICFGLILSFLFGIQACSGVVNEQKLENERRIGVVQIPIAGNQPLNLYAASYALLIGESRYISWPSLESIPGELEQVKAVLQSHGFQVTQKMNLDSVQLKQAFEDFINQYGFEPNNRLLFFFSGHGHTRKNGNKGYIVPIDAPHPDGAEQEFFQKAIEMQLVMTWARKIESNHALFLFDSCFSGTVFKAKNLPEIPKYISEIVAKPVRQFITAGGAGEVVPAKSVFTPIFVDGLREGKADTNHDGFVTGIELGNYLRGEVPKYTQQMPQFGTIKDYELAQGDFVFVLGDQYEETKPVEPVVPPVAGTVIHQGKIHQDQLKDGSLGPKMVLIPAGRFKMGSNEGDSDEKPVHEVSVNRFYMSPFEITLGEFKKFVKEANYPMEKVNWCDWQSGKLAEDDRQPVQCVSWHDAVAYTEWLSQQTGRTYRLPTEAEWEYAARAGSQSKWSFGDDENQLEEYAWYGQNSGGKTHPVGQKRPNQFGLYDMMGNVWEWTHSDYVNSYDGNELRVSKNESNSKSLRGGSWSCNSSRCRVAFRYDYAPADRFNIGFRVLLVLP